MASKAKSIAELTNRFFGNCVGNNFRSGCKIAQKVMRRDALAAWHTPDPEDWLRIHKTESQFIRLRNLEVLRRTGRAPPKKGEGRQAMIKKKK